MRFILITFKSRPKKHDFFFKRRVFSLSAIRKNVPNVDYITESISPVHTVKAPKLWIYDSIP